jgi:hypothetical protein
LTETRLAPASLASRRHQHHAGPGRNAAHCPGRPSSVNGAPRPHSARTRLRRAVDPGASVDPAGLPVRARPEAGPEACAANLREGRDISPGFACLKILGEPA